MARNMIDPIGSDDRRPGSSWTRYQNLYNQTTSQGRGASLYQNDPSTGLAAANRVTQKAEKDGGSAVKNDSQKTGECQTCAERKYVDGSNDPGVSMKSATKVSPESAASTVAAHEQEHVTRNADKAEAEGREVVSSTVKLHTSVCPECGKTYVAGGTTTTVTQDKQDAKKKEAQKEGQRGKLDRLV